MATTYEWTYDKQLDTWVTGEDENGCGVYYEEDDWFWYANVVVGSNIISNTFDTQEEAQRWAEQEWERQKAINQ